jgi:hypothetical protein
MQSKAILHTTGMHIFVPGDERPPTLDELQPSLVSEQSQGTGLLKQSGKEASDLSKQSTGVREREFTWDKTFPFPFVVVFSHAAVTVTLKDKALTQLQPPAAQGTLPVSQLPQGTSTHSVVLSMRGKEVCIPVDLAVGAHSSTLQSALVLASGVLVLRLCL